MTPARTQIARVVGLAACLSVAVGSSPASAYRTSEDSDWNRGNGIVGRVAFEPLPVPFAIYRGTTDVVFADLHAATRTAFETWTLPSCTGLAVRDDGGSTVPAIYGDDRNVIEWVEDGSWTARGFSRFTIGVTTNQFLRVGARWTIDESDMELNADQFRWVIDGGEADADPVDVQGLVVHEAGHFLGLLHACEQTAIDGAPACGSPVEPETMFPLYTGENQRTLEPDDVAGICYLYPAPDCAASGCPAGLRCVGGTCVADDGGVPTDAGRADAGALDAATGGDGGSIDGGSIDGGSIDGGSAADGGEGSGGDGCGCRAARSGRGARGLLFGVVGLALFLIGRRRRGPRPHGDYLSSR